MKKAIVVGLILISCSFAAIAQMPLTFGAWTAYPPISRNGDTLVLLQTSFLQAVDAAARPGVLKLDAICRNGKLYRVALETNIPVSKRSMDFSGAAITTPVSLQADDNHAETQNWAVLDNGHTLSPYAEVLQTKKNRTWIERLAGTDTLILEYRGGTTEDPIQAQFQTEGISKALTAVGCRY